jgi:hypothetical protein
VTLKELEVLTDLYLASLGGLVGVPKPEFLPECHALTERGWLSRRVEDAEVVFEMSNKGLTALALDGLIDPEGRQN